jgi:hypothetical protein
MYIRVLTVHHDHNIIPMTAIRSIGPSGSGTAIEFIDSPLLNPHIMYSPTPFWEVEQQLEEWKPTYGRS